MTTRPAACGPARGILTLNGGSSSLKFALFRTKPSLSRVLDGNVDRRIETAGQRPAADLVLQRIASEPPPGVVGHRIVHGGDRYTKPCIITPAVRADLLRLSDLDPEHLPFEISLIDHVGRTWPDIVQVACFDTAFHRDLPPVARLLPLPRRLYDSGVRRYGFHGLSCTFLLDELERIAGPQAAEGRLVLAHLGSGASLTAITGRRSIDTTMAFTPASGVPMATRSGDLDPGVAGYLARAEGMSAERFDRLVNHESGLLGISGTSSDVRELLAREHDDVRAAEAIDLFCYEIKKRIGSYAAALGGIDRLIFTGGIGENSAPIRARICESLGFLGILLDLAKNDAGAPVVSRDGAPVTVHVMRTDEERVIAEAALNVFEAHPSASPGA